MARFGSYKNISPVVQGERQAASVIKELQGTEIKSVGTVRNYEQALRQIASHFADRDKNGGTHTPLREVTPEQIQSYLEIRSNDVSQKSLDMERQAAQKMMQMVTHKLEPGKNLTVVKSQVETKLETRAYTQEQIQNVCSHMSERDALSAAIVHNAGLRSHEVFTLRPVAERAADIRPAREEKFSGRTGLIYTVEGKGGLIREVMISNELAQRLEQTRHESPEKITDRGVHYQSCYNVSGGQLLSQAWSTASQDALGFSTGLHGLRHSYAQERMAELQSQGMDRQSALETVSQELGHFRYEITEVYQR